MRAAFAKQFAQDFPDDAGELEAVAGTRTGNEHLGMRRMPIDEEMMVRRVRVHANHCGTQWPVGARKKLSHDPAHGFDFVWRHVAVDGIGIDDLALVMAGDFHPIAEVWEAVKVSARVVFPDMNRTATRLKQRRVYRLEPELNLALDRKRQFQVRQQRLNPT